MGFQSLALLCYTSDSELDRYSKKPTERGLFLMSKKRMFSPSITESDAFLDMPLSTQALYFHLCMSADDDGFVNPKRVVRMSGANDDDLKILIAKRFILLLASGVVVIKHWLINNTIRSDRYTTTTYKDELASLIKNSNNSYTEKDKVTTLVEQLTDSGNQSQTNGIPNVIPTVHLEKLREAKVRVDKVSNNSTNVLLAEKPPKNKSNEDINFLFNYWHEQMGIPITSNRQRNRNACNNLFKRHTRQGVIQLIDGCKLALQDQYAPRISDFVGLQTKLNDLLIWGKKKGFKNNAKAVDLTR